VGQPPFDAIYVAVFIDAIHVKVRDGQVANRPVYAAIGVTVDGHKDVLGLWMGTGSEGAKFWMGVLVDLKNRGIQNVFFLVCDGPQRPGLGRGERDINPIYAAPNPDAALAALGDLDEKWGIKYAAMIRLWRNAWNEFVPFLDYDIEIRRMICSTNAIESLNARYHPVTRLITRSLRGSPVFTKETSDARSAMRRSDSRPPDSPGPGSPSPASCLIDGAAPVPERDATCSWPRSSLSPAVEFVSVMRSRKLAMISTKPASDTTPPVPAPQCLGGTTRPCLSTVGSSRPVTRDS